MRKSKMNRIVNAIPGFIMLWLCVVVIPIALIGAPILLWIIVAPMLLGGAALSVKLMMIWGEI